jgi:predicted kinase
VTAPALVVTCGLPGSGKTAWARAWVATDPVGRARVNRDVLFRGWTGNHAQEDAVTVAQRAAVAALLQAGRSVVCDDTNLLNEYVDRSRCFAASAGAAVGVHGLTGVPVETCIARDAARAARGGRHVGEQVIRNMLVPSPRHSQPRTPPEVLQLATALKKENPSRSAAQIRRILSAQHGWAAAGPSPPFRRARSTR